MFRRGRLPFLQCIPLRTHLDRVPWVKRVVHVEVIVVCRHRHDETCPVVFDEFHQSVRIPFLSLEQRNQILVAELRWMPVTLGVPLGQGFRHTHLARVIVGDHGIHAASIVGSIVGTVLIGGR